MSTLPPIAPPPGFEKLSKEEPIRYVQQLWELIATSPDEVPVPQWHLDVVRDRIPSYDLEQASPWGEVKQRLLSKYRDANLPVVFDPKTEDDVDAAVQWYAQQRSELVQEFLEALDVALERVVQYP